jgi:hypothetical protein
MPGLDMMQVGYKQQWGKEGRDDLGMIKRLGANAVRIYHGFGQEGNTDHAAFLDRAEELGLHVLVGFHTQNVCPDFDCFDSWQKAAQKGFQQGLQKNGKWHPAVAMVVLMDVPDDLNFILEDGNPTNCSASKDLKGDQGKCRTKAALSATEGFLAAEKAAGVNGSGVNLTVAWSTDRRDSVDGIVKNGFGTYGFQDMKIGVSNPKVAKYDARDHKNLQKAFTDRWVHSVNSGAPWKLIHDQISGDIQKYSIGPTPWFVAQFAADSGVEDVQADLQAMDTEAKTGGAFLGASFYEFQHDYLGADTHGLFKLGATALGEVNPCEQDVRTSSNSCNKFIVHCLAMGDASRADHVAAAWNGVTSGHGTCVDGTDEDLVVV